MPSDTPPQEEQAGSQDKYLQKSSPPFCQTDWKTILCTGVAPAESSGACGRMVTMHQGETSVHVCQLQSNAYFLQRLFYCFILISSVGLKDSLLANCLENIMDENVFRGTASEKLISIHSQFFTQIQQGLLLFPELKFHHTESWSSLKIFATIRWTRGLVILFTQITFHWGDLEI